MNQEHEELIKWIKQQYDTGVIGLHILASGAKTVYRVERTASPDWVLRLYPRHEEAEAPTHVAALASVLTFLEEQAYPAEQLVRATDGDAITHWGDETALMTTFLGQALTVWQPASQQANSEHSTSDTARNADQLAYTPALLFALGKAIAQLHTLQPDATLPPAGMLPSRELAWAGTNLTRMAGKAPANLQAQYEHLVTAVQQADRYEDLPPALIHNDCNLSNVVITETGQTALIDWESAGRGPAIIDLGILLSNCYAKQQRQIQREAVAAVVAGYCQHRRPSAVELARLPDAIRFFRLVLLAGSLPDRISERQQDDELIYGATYPQWQAQYEASDEIAALARMHFEQQL